MTENHERPISEYMTRVVEIVDGDCTVGEAADIMRKKDIGCVLIRESRDVFGIFTERDFMRNFASHRDDEGDFVSRTMAEVIDKGIKTVNPQVSSRRVIDIMRKENIRYMPVVEKGNIVGLVSLPELLVYEEKRQQELNQSLSDKTEQLTHKTAKLKTIIKLTEQLVSDMDPSDLLRYITKIARELVHADTASVILLKEDEGELTVAASEFVGVQAEGPSTYPSLEENKSITALVIKNRRPLLLCGKIDEDERFKHLACNDAIKCSICVPLIYRDTVKGTLNLNILHSDYTFTQEDLETAITLASHVSVAIENSDMYKDLQSMYLQSLKVANERMNKMNEELKIAHERIDKEIETVAIVQHGLLPNSLPQNKKIDIAALYAASTTVGGDYYDCIEMDHGRLAIVMSDVTGHGLPAAFVMTMVKILLFYLNQKNISLEQTVATINDMFSCHIPISTFPSLIYGIFNPDDRTLTYINAGHEPLVLINPAHNKKEFYYAQSSLLGIETGTKFTTSTINVQEGDRLCLYTDGIPEAMNKDKEFFTRERFVDVLYTHAAEKPKEMIDAVMKEVNSFCGGLAFADDVTLMILGF